MNFCENLAFIVGINFLLKEKERHENPRVSFLNCIIDTLQRWTQLC